MSSAESSLLVQFSIDRKPLLFVPLESTACFFRNFLAARATLLFKNQPETEHGPGWNLSSAFVPMKDLTNQS